MSSKPELHKTSKARLLCITRCRDPIPHSFVDELGQLVKLSRFLQMLPVITLPPDHIDSSLKRQPQKNVAEVTQSMRYEVLEIYFPVRIGRSSQQGTNHFNQNSIRVGAREKQMISCLVWLPTEQTALTLTPSSHSITCGESVLHCQPDYKSKARYSMM